MSFYKKHKALILTIIVTGLFTILYHQYNQWDFKNYHFYSAYAFLNDRLTTDVAPAQFQGYFNPFLDIFNYLLIKIFVYPSFYQFFFGIGWAICFYLLFKIIKRAFNNTDQELQRFAIITAFLIGISDSAVLTQIGMGFTDPQVSAFVMIALFYTIKSIDIFNEKLAIRYMLIAGLAMGLAVGLKLTTVPYFFGLIAAWCLYPYYTLRRFYLLAVFGIGFIITFMLTEGYWMWHMYQLFQNPLFPQFNDFFHSPYADPYSFKDNRFLPPTLMKNIFLPFYGLQLSPLGSENEFRNWRLAILMILMFLALIKFVFTAKGKTKAQFAAKDRQVQIFLFVFFIVSYIAWLKIFAIYRYIIPVAILSGIFIVAFSLYLLRPLKNIKLKKYVLTALTLILIVTTHYQNYGKIPFIKTEVITPKLPPNSYVLMAVTDAPHSYLIPYFSKDVTFLCPLNNFMSPWHQPANLMEQKVTNIVNNKNNRLFVIDYPNNDGTQNIPRMLNYYHLHKIPGTCQNITSTFDRNFFIICELKHDN